MSPLVARTLVEAYLYIDLAALAADDRDEESEEAGPVRDHQAATTITEGREAWTLRFDGRDLEPALEVVVLVPYQTEYQARQEGLRFGDGPSELIDAGQWRVVSAGYARRTMRNDLEFAEDPGDPRHFQSVVTGWESARDAAIEVAKFLPDGADAVPASAFWSEMGSAAHRDEPELFTREALETDIAFFQETLDDFIVTHTGRRS
ncbi:hypothetical protein [Sphaerisporangium corydalis]|uniref:Uncharacterized protein n=1 Tax=Sphaerisporangium corydalis TaxID=1441875 RepID=A0ABV9E8C2_9ACTN|nr:hypothetical protein [Sphaerisporangium corydalis]